MNRKGVVEEGRMGTTGRIRRLFRSGTPAGFEGSNRTRREHRYRRQIPRSQTNGEREKRASSA